MNTTLMKRVLRRGLATISFNKTGAPASVCVVGPDPEIKSLGENDVTIKMLAAPVSPVDLGTIRGNLPGPSAFPAVPGGEGVGIVTAVGSKVSGIAINDWVVPITSSLGTWRSNARSKASDVTKVPSDIPVEYAANFNSALTALKVLDGLQEGDYLVQYDAESSVGLAVIQIAKLKGIDTINIVAEGPSYFDRAGLVKDLGGDVVFKDTYLGSAGLKKILADLPKPKLGLSGSSIGASAIGPLLGGAKVITYGGSSSEPLKGGEVFSASEWLKKASAGERTKAIDEVASLFRSGSLDLWVERHPISDLKFALAEAEQPFKTRKVVLVVNEVQTASPKLTAEDLGKLSADFEAAFGKLRA